MDTALAGEMFQSPCFTIATYRLTIAGVATGTRVTLTAHFPEQCDHASYSMI